MPLRDDQIQTLVPQLQVLVVQKILPRRIFLGGKEAGLVLSDYQQHLYALIHELSLG